MGGVALHGRVGILLSPVFLIHTYIWLSAQRPANVVRPPSKSLYTLLHSSPLSTNLPSSIISMRQNLNRTHASTLRVISLTPHVPIRIFSFLVLSIRVTPALLLKHLSFYSSNFRLPTTSNIIQNCWNTYTRIQSTVRYHIKVLQPDITTTAGAGGWQPTYNRVPWNGTKENLAQNS